MSPPNPDFLREFSRHHEAEPDDLATRLMEGERAALDEALARYWTPAVHYAHRWSETVEDAKDIVQEAFLQLWDGADHWTPHTEVRPLLFGIVRKLALKELRRRAVRATHAEQVREVSRPRIADPAEEAVAAEFENALVDAIEQLPERRRRVFVLSRRKGLSHQEIAMELGISPQTVANQLSSALEQLRRTLQPFLHRSAPKPDLRIVRGDRDAAKRA